VIIGVAFYNKETEMLISLPKPNRHHDVFDQLRGPNLSRDTGWVQGFVDSKGRFFDREAAARYVREIGQELTKEGKTDSYPDELFSEDVW